MSATCTSTPPLWPLSSSLTLSSQASQLFLTLRTVGAVQGQASVGYLHVDAAAAAASFTLTLFSRESQLLLVVPTVGAVEGRGRRSCGHCAVAYLVRAFASASKLLLGVRTVCAATVQGRSSVGHMHVDAAAAAASLTLTPFFASLVSSCLLHLPWVR